MYGDLCDELTPRCELKNVKILQDLMICFNQLPGVQKNPPCPVWPVEKKDIFENQSSESTQSLLMKNGDK